MRRSTRMMLLSSRPSNGGGNDGHEEWRGNGGGVMIYNVPDYSRTEHRYPDPERYPENRVRPRYYPRNGWDDGTRYMPPMQPRSWMPDEPYMPPLYPAEMAAKPMIGYDRDEDMGQDYARQMGGAASRMSAMPMNEAAAMRWTKKMKNADGSTGEHWRIDQTEQYRKSVCPECDKWEFYVAMNAMYSDYYDVARMFGADKPDFYAKMAKAFLCDEDAVENKIALYGAYIVK